MAKTKSYEQLSVEITELKASKKTVNNEIGGIRLKFNIKKGEKPADKKVLKDWNALHEEKAKMAAALEKLEEAAKELRPKKVRETKYEYPADCESKEDRKNFRSRMRTLAATDSKAEKKADKKGKKVDKTEKVEATKGKSKKADKAAPPAEKSSSKKGKNKKSKKSGKSED